MKKIIVAILAILYMGTSTGATLHMHFCMGKLADWGLSHNDSKTCGKCGMEQSEIANGCCKDEQKFVKNNADQKNVEVLFQVNQAIAIALPVSFFVMPSVNFPAETISNFVSNTPPRCAVVAVYIRNCVFLI
jgi:hypothetical protein